MTRKHSPLLTAVAVCSLTLSGCGSDDGTGGSNEAVILPPDPSTAPKYPNPGGGGGEKAGKGKTEQSTPPEQNKEGEKAASPPESNARRGGGRSQAVALNNGKGELTAENTRIVFVGIHTDPEKPDPRTGGFQEFFGSVEVTDGKVTALEVDIDMNSVFTSQDKLTNHLKNADFFETNEFPHAKFVASNVAEDGTVTGQLTLHGVTKEITFPADLDVSEDGLSMRAEFSLNRFDFNMNGVKDNVANEVKMSVVLGQGTNKQAILGGGGRQGGGRRGFDPMAMFERQDADKDGVLKGDEIPERMRGRLEMIDTDKNGEVSKEEMQALAERIGGGGREGQ